MPSVVAQARSLPAKSQVKLYCTLAVAVLLMGALFLVDWNVYIKPDPERLIQVEGKLTSNGEVWKQDRSIVYFGVAPRGAYQDRQRVYAYKDVFQTTGLRRGAKVSLVVEQTAEGVVVRELSTLEGRVLFDANMHEHVVASGNNAVLRAIALTIFLVALLLVSAFVIWRRHLRVPGAGTSEH